MGRLKLWLLDADVIIDLLGLNIKEGLTFCSCDAATIRALPLFDLAERGVSTETLLRKSGLLKPGLQERHTEEYFRNNLRIGQEDRLLLQRW